MGRRSVALKHLAFPLLGAAAVFIRAVLREGFSFEVLLAQLFYTSLFFAAPHLLWAVAARVLNFQGLRLHAGFLLCSFILVAVAAMPMFVRGDPSGLPYHWMLYWPAAALGMLVFGLAFAFRNRRADA